MMCLGGTTSTPDICFEPCGDGKNAGFFQCDDGNIFDGDGCSASCEVEAGFQCIGGTANNRDTCLEICGDGQN